MLHTEHSPTYELDWSSLNILALEVHLAVLLTLLHKLQLHSERTISKLVQCWNSCLRVLQSMGWHHSIWSDQSHVSADGLWHSNGHGRASPLWAHRTSQLAFLKGPSRFYIHLFSWRGFMGLESLTPSTVFVKHFISDLEKGRRIRWGQGELNNGRWKAEKRQKLRK